MNSTARIRPARLEAVMGFRSTALRIIFRWQAAASCVLFYLPDLTGPLLRTRSAGLAVDSGRARAARPSASAGPSSGSGSSGDRPLSQPDLPR
jgi:hypothetical protein